MTKNNETKNRKMTRQCQDARSRLLPLACVADPKRSADQKPGMRQVIPTLDSIPSRQPLIYTRYRASSTKNTYILWFVSSQAQVTSVSILTAIVTSRITVLTLKLRQLPDVR